MSKISENIAIAGVMQKQRNLSNFQKGMIIHFRVKIESISKAVNFINSSHAAMVKVYCVWQIGTIKNQRCNEWGAPRSIHAKGECLLWRWIPSWTEEFATVSSQRWFPSIPACKLRRQTYVLCIYDHWSLSERKAGICTLVLQLNVPWVVNGGCFLWITFYSLLPEVSKLEKRSIYTGECFRGIFSWCSFYYGRHDKSI